MTIIEILALIFVIALALKLLMLIWAQKFSYKKAKYFLDRPRASVFLSLVLLVVLGYFLFQEMTTVQVAAAALFVLLLEAVAFFSCSHLENMKETYKKAFMSKGLIKKNWFAAIVWLIFAFWVVLKIFA
jgi:hypothetical protein